MRWGIIGAAAVTLAVAEPSAHAKPGKNAKTARAANRVAVLPVDFEGDVPEAWRHKMTDDLVRGLVRAGFDTIAPNAVQAEPGIEACDNERCLGYIADAVGSRYIVRSRIRVKDKDYELQADVLDSEDGSLVASSRETCDLCGAAEVSDLIAAQAASLQQKIQSLTLGPALYTFTSAPQGARIYVDGELVGTTPLEYEVPPGEHRAQATLPGHLPQTRTVTAVKGVRENLEFTLQVQPTDVRLERRNRAMRISGATLVGVGVAAVAAGATFLVIHGRPYESACSGDDVDAAGNCRRRYNTLIHGASLAAVGGAALATGVGLLVVGRKRKGGAQEAQARVGLSPTGIVLRGRF